jgi:hypothetical protein
MMNNKDLSKKVLASLLTMSCVYLGGTFELPTTEAAYLQGSAVDGNATYDFEDGATISMPGSVFGRPIAVTATGENMTINANGAIKVVGASNDGVVKSTGGTLNFTGQDITIEVPFIGDYANNGMSTVFVDGGTVNFSNNSTNLIINGENTSNTLSRGQYGIYSMNGGSVNIDNELNINVNVPKAQIICGIFANASNIHAKDKTYIQTVATDGNNRGVQASNNSNIIFDSSLDVKTTGNNTSSHGVLALSGGKIEVRGALTVDVSGSAGGAALQAQGAGSSAKILGAADISLMTSGSGFAVVAMDQGIVDFDGTVFINKDNVKEDHLKNAAIAAQANGTVNINQFGGNQVVIKGGISANGGNVNLALDRADSLLEGFIITGNGGSSNFDLSNNAVWRVSNVAAMPDLTNTLSSLVLNNAIIDMTFDEAATTQLVIDNYDGTGGSFIMDTDLASETDGDKVNISIAESGITYVQVKDASLTNGVEVNGVKNLLLITDASQTADFVGKNLNAGGLWDVIPTIERGTKALDADGNPIGTAYQWYLTKLQKTVNNDTKVLLDAADNSYALWRNTSDSLRKRLGELRFRTNATDGDGIWVRYTNGKFSGSGFDSSYNMYQLGYDKADNAKSTYGFAVDSGTGHANYASGGGKDKLTALSVYGTWTGEKGNYTDVVARVGQFDTDVDSYGDYPDKASYKNRAYSLSVEYGKRIELSKERGTFIEPQAQLIIGRLGSNSYITDRGTAVAVEGMNSAIARLGVVAGKKINDGSDIYFKVSALHEFAGERDISMRAANGEVLAGSNDYGDTWFELGFGGNVKLGGASHLYGDIERSFGADIQKKWQINAGVRFEF